MSVSTLCLGCLLILAVELFGSCSANGSGTYESIEVITTEADQCSDIKSAVGEVLNSSQINTTSHEIVVEGQTCILNKTKRNTEHEYEVIMQDKTLGSFDDDKTNEVRNYICGNCAAIKLEIGDQFKSIACEAPHSDCVVNATTTTITATTTIIGFSTTTTTSSVMMSTTTTTSSVMMSTTTTTSSVVISTSTSMDMTLTADTNSTSDIPSNSISDITLTTTTMTIFTTSQSFSSVVIPNTQPIVPTVSTTIIKMTFSTASPTPYDETTTDTTIVTTTTPMVSSSPQTTTDAMAPITISDSDVTSSSISKRPVTTKVSSEITTTSQTPTEEATDGGVVDTIIIVAPATVLGIVLVISVVVICSLCMLFNFKRIKLEKDKTRHPPNVWVDTKPTMGSHPLVELQSENRRPMRPSRVSFVSKGNVVLQTLSHPLSVEELALSLQNLDKLVAEYMTVPPNLVGQNEIPVGAEGKNRYIDVLPNPNTRVPLFLKFGVAHSDYINANYIRGHRNQPKQYIGTQGPLTETLNDFWRMIWEQKVPVIIMATELVERNMEKCVQYWPDQQGYGVAKVYGEFEVTLRKRNRAQAYTVTTFSVAHLERHVSREITHYWFNGWPDHGVPSSASDFIDFLLETRTKREGFNMPGPTLVHCSAGIGRTGVFIAADIGMRQLEENMTVDVLKILATMRMDKGGMIQTKEQYIFLHKALNEYASRVGTVNTMPRFDSDDGGLNGGFYDDDEADATVTTFA